MDVKDFSKLVKHIYTLPLDIENLHQLLTEAASQIECKAIALHVLDRENVYVIKEVVLSEMADEAPPFEDFLSDLKPYLTKLRVSGSEGKCVDPYIFKNNQLVLLEQAGSLIGECSVTPCVFSLLCREGDYWVQLSIRDVNGRVTLDRLTQSFALFRPHIHQVFKILQKVGGLKSHQAGLKQVMNHFHSGTILFNGNGQPVFQNRRASELIAEHFDLNFESGELFTQPTEISKGLQGLVRDAINLGKDLSKKVGVMNLDSLRSNLSVVAVPLHPDIQALVAQETGVYAALIFGTSETPEWLNPEVFQLLFGLTAPETKLAVELANGTSLSEYCDKYGMKIHTVRSYLKLIFQKTETNRQAELVALLRSVPLPSL